MRAKNDVYRRTKSMRSSFVTTRGLIQEMYVQGLDELRQKDRQEIIGYCVRARQLKAGAILRQD